ncbi:MAG: hypothetical protein ACRDOK_19750 [Streptosporangiaceae bacterium]
MAVTFSLVVLLGITVWVLHRYAGLKFLHALACVLFGFLLAATGAAPAIRQAVASVVALISGHR